MGPGNRLTVYLAEDSPMVRERLTALLADVPGVEVVGHGTTAAMAGEGICRLRPDLIVLDLQLREGDGFEVLDRLERDRAGPMVVVLTNHASDECRQRALEGGADYFLDKSCEFDRLVELSRRLLGRNA